ncbi:hypothetical protein M2451_002622 [Dysgonomonas sp. PFB1-18]|uniref:ADP-ribosyltransferase n=1 Tax=unclassified Dysgonomonas TaxID=2630389 RepID=UPI0024745B22|nr:MULTISPECIES: ADP-ribosyltransferase [unclassified Dysgonomonas]MDH6308103.1 hypothetical protein [Dysgonomonas sp. PF1-14]MDH6339642.1 hypothetical protein [Dysgonomonas sp. PF1-16]MDH6381293.1 hypothetical protein [Dysgonomonas sp. PFB1-18]MDH6398505.1 hypothetical protein [Dysgonomonas sp. PF1-23]
MNTKKLYGKLNKRTEFYAAQVRKIYNEKISEIIALCDGIEVSDDTPFKFADYEDIAPEVQKTLRNMYSQLYQSVRGNVTKEWNYSNVANDKLVQGIFGKKSIEDNHFAKYFQRNKEAMNSFFARKEDGLDLSQRVWKFVGEAKEELELALDLGLGEGLSADALSRVVRNYLHDTDKLFRRVRNKHGDLVLSKAAKAYHPGRGVYRSSYKNAQRLTRTETNMAYRTADITRWQQMDFIIGYEVKLSNNHPEYDICDELAGKYKKDFVFKGWHPNCRCYIVPILCTEDELEQLTEMILRGEESSFVPADIVEDVPEGFNEWIVSHTEQIEKAKINNTLPYFIKDNYKNGDISKGFAWAENDKNISGLQNFNKLLSKHEIDVDKFTNMQSFTNELWRESSNNVYNDKEFTLSNAVPKNKVQFEQAAKLSDKKILQELLDDALYGDDNSWMFLNDDILEELQKVATQKRFLSSNDAKFVFGLDKEALENAIKGDTAIFSGSRYIGTNYSTISRQAIKNGVISGDNGAICAVNIPKGSRYLQTMDGEEQLAMLLPNSRFKVVSTETKTIIQGGKSTKVLQYNMELVDDGSEYVKGLTTVKAEVKANIAAYNQAVKVANNVLKVADEWDGVYGVDMDKLAALVKTGGAKEIKAEATALAKSVSKAKQQAINLYKEQPIEWGLTKEFGADTAKAFLENWHKHVDKAAYMSDSEFLEKVIKKELYYAKLNPTKYPTTPKFIYYFEKLEVQYETKLVKTQLLDEVQHSFNYAQKTKSAKVKSMVAELQDMFAGTTNADTLKIKIDALNKEVARLEKEKAKLAAKNGKLIQENAFETTAYTKARKDAAMWAKTAEEADEKLRDKCGELWRTATQAERDAAYYYTSGSSYVNEPLRGLTYYGSKGRNSGVDITNLTNLIDKSTYNFDMWLQRGEGVNGFSGKFGVDLRGLTEKEAQSLVGKIGEEKAFMSCGDAKGKGFTGDIIYNIYCPKGTKGLYCEPFSAFGHGNGHSWDGLAKQSSVGYEAEVLLQRSTKFKITKIEQKGGRWYVDMDVVGQL